MLVTVYGNFAAKEQLFPESGQPSRFLTESAYAVFTSESTSAPPLCSSCSFVSVAYRYNEFIARKATTHSKHYYDHCPRHPPGPRGASRATAFISGAALTPRLLSKHRNAAIRG